ncbi:hypothetical protein CK203_065847 [Vitis vinifera]|uniref:Uncharacterized protein n=1 Tax=Vitis vinifera TaxID=29760 RepID=A0A438FXR4_VITVI|nr:hypothetical protein CK203_065847 [Vitis vinifera]
MFSFEANLEIKRNQFNFELVSVVTNFVDYFLNQGAPAGHQSAETPIGNESLSDPEAKYVLVELHEGVCGNHPGGRTLSYCAYTQGYY